MTIAIVTPWRDHPELIDDYFAAVNAGKPDQLIVVDDGSDPPLEFAALRLDKPSGFCTATNAGLALVETEQVLFMNNDVSALRPGWLDEIRDVIKPGYVIGPLRKDPHGAVDGVPYPYVDGWALGMMTADVRAMGGWDETYDEAGPAYFSDNAFSFQARLHGLTLRAFRPGLLHKGGQTGGSGPSFEHALKVNAPLFAEQVRAVVGKPEE